jgi:hypothetical protein
MTVVKVLLHMCCGPCSCFPVQSLREQGYLVTGYFYNPNIHPYREFTRRLTTTQEYATKVALELVVDHRYTLEEFLQQALTAPAGRCRECYLLRLRQTARFAKQNGFPCFSTTLLVSPYQQHELIKEMGEQVARQEGITFLYQDFRTGWQAGVEVSKQLELYRQPYCGCIFSERDRYLKPAKVMV